MKLVTFELDGATGYGVVKGDRIFRLDATPGAPVNLKSWLSNLDSLPPAHEALPSVRVADVRLLPPIPNPGKVLCVATNFHEDSNADNPTPRFPLTFTRFASAQTGHDSPMLMPAASKTFDFEGELAVIIGRPGHKIPRAAAMAHVAGYSCFNDGSVRDWQKHSSQFTPGKNFFESAGFGPYLVTANEIPDPTRLSLETRVNGVVQQSVTMDRMIFDIPWLIAYFTTFTPLEAGDVIVTGTPSGAGSSRTPQEWLAEGDTIEVEIPGVGLLRNTVARDTDPRSLDFSQR